MLSVTELTKFQIIRISSYHFPSIRDKDEDARHPVELFRHSDSGDITDEAVSGASRECQTFSS